MTWNWFFWCRFISFPLRSLPFFGEFKSSISKASCLFIGLFPLIFFFNNYNYSLFVIIFGVIFLLNVAYYLVNRNPEGGKIENILLALSPMSFFVYCFHEPIQGLIKKVFYMLLQPSSDAMLVLLYFLCPLLTILLAIIIFKTMSRYCPKILRVINGR